MPCICPFSNEIDTFFKTTWSRKTLHHVLYFNTSFHKDSFHTDFSTSMFRLRSVTHEAADKAANKANSANKIYVRLGYIELPS